MIYLWRDSQLEIFNKRARTNHIQKELQLLHFSNLFRASGSCTVFTFIVKLVKYSSASDLHQGCAHTQPMFMLGFMFIRRVHSSSLKSIGGSVSLLSSRPDGWSTLSADFPSPRTPVASARRGTAPWQRTLSYSACVGAALLDGGRHKYLMRGLSRSCIKDAAPCLTRSQQQLQEQFTQRWPRSAISKIKFKSTFKCYIATLPKQV